jgi:TolB-like protein
MMKTFFFALFVLLLLTANQIKAQITVAIGDFENNTGLFYLDAWEKSIPDYLKSTLSKSERLIIVERTRLEEVLKEQALSMTGLVDTSTAQRIGTLLGAAYVISGTISQSGEWLRIDATIIKTETGQLKGEKVQAQGETYLGEMISLLGQNITYILTGTQRYQNKIVIKKYPTNYFLLGTAGLAIATFFANKAYHDKLDAYRNASRLDEFDETYDAANRLKHTRTVLLSLTAAALIGTAYCWIGNMSPDEIVADELVLIPSVRFDLYRGFYASVSIHF